MYRYSYKEYIDCYPEDMVLYPPLHLSVQSCTSRKIFCVLLCIFCIDFFFFIKNMIFLLPLELNVNVEIMDYILMCFVCFSIMVNNFLLPRNKRCLKRIYLKRLIELMVSSHGIFFPLFYYS